MVRRPRVAMAATLVLAALATGGPAGATGPAAATAAVIGGQLDTIDDPALAEQVARITRDRTDRRDASVTVEVLYRGDPAAAMAAVTSAGGTITGEAPGSVVQAVVPVAALARLDEAAAIDYVRAPRRTSVSPRPGAYLAAGPVTTEAVAVTNAAAWHTAGFTGAGAKVGIIDYFNGTKWNAQVAAGEVPPASATFCADSVPDGFDDCPGGSVFDPLEDGHGNAVAEIITDLAPQAQLYLGRGSSISDMYALVDWFAANGVRIVNRSLGSPYDGPGDGTGELDALVDHAARKGITWINSAGNEGSQQYWRGSWTDTDGDNWMEFGPGDETLDIDTFQSGGCVDILGFRWSDWGAAATRTDYDVYVYEDGVRSYPDHTGNYPPNQQSGAPPIELDGVGGCSSADVDVRVYRAAPGSGSAGDVLELLVYSGELERSQSASSAGTGIVDSRNRAVLAIGAVDPATSGTIGYYSSQGPTNDGRVKPDVAGVAGLSTSVFGTRQFSGTSAAAPAVAGIAALLAGANQAATAEGLAAAVKFHVVDRGAPGADNVYGAGEVRLGSPPSGPPSTSPAAYTAITPTRIYDTRTNGVGVLRPEAIVAVPVAGGPAVPAGATAVALNVTIVGATVASYAQVFPTGAAAIDGSSNVNLETVGQTLPNFAVTPIGQNGTVSVYSPAGGHLLVDVLGYFVPSGATAAGRVVSLTPTRVLDTRQKVATSPGVLPTSWTDHRPVAGESVPVEFRPSSGLPATGVAAVVLNVTGTGAAGSGFVTAFPTGAPLPNASTLNLVEGSTNANTVIVPLGAERKVSLYTERGAHLIADLVGYVTDAGAVVSTTGRFVPVSPARISDSRAAAAYASGESRPVAVAALGGIPATGVDAVSFNMTAIDAQGSEGYLQAAPAGSTPVAEFSTLNWSRVGQTIATGTILKLGTAGQIALRTYQGAHVAVDVNGYFTS